MKVKSKLLYLGDRTITVKISPPIFSRMEQDKRNREIERRLFDVLPQICWAGVGQSHPCSKEAAEVQYNCRLAPV